MRFVVNIVLLCLFTLVACTKERTCQCKNSTSTYDAGTVDKTRAQAKRYCKTLSAGETVCSLKD